MRREQTRTRRVSTSASSSDASLNENGQTSFAAMLRLHVGTSGYNFPEWKGSFYPPKLPSAKWLEFYAQQLRTVEINYTFYRMPSAKTIAGWDAITPAECKFVLKAPQRITHFMPLRDIDEPLRLFPDPIRKLNPKLGSALFPPPPNCPKPLHRLGYPPT